MSVKQDIFKAIQDQINTQIDGVWVDKNMGQIANLDNYDSFPLPGVLIEFGRGTYRNVSKGVQEWTGIIKFYLIYENYSHSDAESEDRELALEFFKFTEDVHQALEGFSTPDFTSLTRVADEEDNNHTHMVVTVLEYATTYIDRSKEQQRTLVEVAPELVVTHTGLPTRPASSFKSAFYPPGKEEDYTGQ
jgi:hypothetical protein